MNTFKPKPEGNCASAASSISRLWIYEGRTVAYDQGFLRVTWGFTIVNTEEIAQTGLNLTDIDVGPAYSPAASLAEIDIAVVGPLLLTRIQTLMASNLIRWADYSRSTYVRIAAVGISGAEIGDAKLFEDPVPNPGTFSDVPPQASIVGSLRSGFSTGSANFGRMYLPHSAFNLAVGSPFADIVDVGNFATVFQTFLNGVETDLNAAVTSDLDVTIMTQVVGGTSKVVTQVAIGNVIDTQRRRRNQLPETYVFRTVP